MDAQASSIKWTDGVRELAQDLRCLAWLHAEERDGATWLALYRAGFPMGLYLAGGNGVPAMTRALETLAEVHAHEPQRVDDRLAADYAAIYLTHALRASPCESVWRDEDHLILQEPTFAVREVYRRHGIGPLDWRAMPDDHLVHELCFVAHLLEADEQAAALDFLDHHLLTWLPQFAERVAQRADTLVYAALALLTVDAMNLLRARLSQPLPGAELGPDQGQ
jgi:TorA maturation chaperone TorD